MVLELEDAQPTATPVGAAEGCDLLILIFKNTRSKDRSLRQLLHGEYGEQ
jgi:hypothetical protein